MEIINTFCDYVLQCNRQVTSYYSEVKSVIRGERFNK